MKSRPSEPFMDEHEQNSHIAHKKKAMAKQKKPKTEQYDEYGFDDVEDAKEYERFIK